MIVTLVILVLAYLVTLIALFRKERDAISYVSAFLLTAGLCAGIVKERSLAKAAIQAVKDRARTEEEQKSFHEKRAAEDREQIQQLRQQSTTALTRLEALSLAARNPETKSEINTLRTEITNTPSVVKVVSIHVGGDDSKAGVFKYDAPEGYRIKDVKLRERSKGGDAHYSQKLVSPTHLEVSWSVKSRTVRGPFKMVVNTITAFLDLAAVITLEKTNPSG